MKTVPKGSKGKGLGKLPKTVRNKMGYAKKGGAVQSKLKEITAALNKASKMHAAQAKVLASIRKKMK